MTMRKKLTLSPKGWQLTIVVPYSIILALITGATCGRDHISMLVFPSGDNPFAKEPNSKKHFQSFTQQNHICSVLQELPPSFQGIRAPEQFNPLKIRKGIGIIIVGSQALATLVLTFQLVFGENEKDLLWIPRLSGSAIQHLEEVPRATPQSGNIKSLEIKHNSENYYQEVSLSIRIQRCMKITDFGNFLETLNFSSFFLLSFGIVSICKIF